ncbi:hypothetical protein ACLUUI_20030 [Enterobacterales bacterium AW_CKDN230030176-1A_HGKHYDSX7]
MADKNMMLNAFLTRIEHLEGDDECLEPIKPVLRALSKDVLNPLDTPDNAFLISRFEHCMHEINAFEDSIETVERESILEFLYALGDAVGLSSDDDYLEAWRGDW